LISTFSFAAAVLAILALTSLVLGAALLLAGACLKATDKLVAIYSHITKKMNWTKSAPAFVGVPVLVVALSGLALLLIGLYISVTTGTGEMDWKIMDVLLSSTAMAIVPASLAVLASIAVSIGIRCKLAMRGEDPSMRAVTASLPLMAMYLVPPTAFMICAFWWGELLHLPRSTSASWVLGEVMLILPLLTAFALAIHSSVTNGEIEFSLATMGFIATAKTSFFRRFPNEYLLLFLLAFLGIVQEFTISSMAAPAVPSLAVELANRIDGRGASRTEAAAIVMFLCALSVAAWTVCMRLSKRPPSPEELR
jgi:hypothetical protein